MRDGDFSLRDPGRDGGFFRRHVGQDSSSRFSFPKRTSASQLPN